MNIGDRVRLMHYKQEGIITKIIDEKLLEVEIEDDFKIPVLKSEVVFVAKEESQRFGSGDTQSPALDSRSSPATGRQAKAEVGIYAGIVADSKEVYSIFLINNTDRPLPYCLTEQANGQYAGRKAGCLAPKSYEKVHSFSFASLNDRNTLVLQWLHFPDRATEIPSPVQRDLLIRPQHLQKAKEKLPQVGKEGILIQLDGKAQGTAKDLKPATVDASALQDQLNSGTAIEDKVLATAPAAEVDLHIEKICQHYMDLSSTEILLKQLDHFDEALERALAADMEEIVFIHGVGNGKLRGELHKRLGKNAEIKHFKDAMREKFGYGGTVVRLR